MKNDNPSDSSAEKHQSSSDQLTVLVFKDNFASRSFKIPLYWVRNLGILVAALIFLTLASLLIAAKSGYLLRQTSPAHLRALETEIAQLKQNAVKTSTISAPTPATPVIVAAPIPTVTVTVTATAAPIPAVTVTTAAAPAPTVTVTTAAPKAEAKVETKPEAKPETKPETKTDTKAIPKAPAVLASGTEVLPDAASLPIKLDTFKTSWSNKRLSVYFAIQHQGFEPGTTSGRIVILARGPQALFAYPPRSLVSSDVNSAIDPSRGEYFSVTRFRETRAKLGPIERREDVRELEVLIYTTSGTLLIHDKMKLSDTEAPPEKPKVTKKKTDETESLHENEMPSEAPAAEVSPSPSPETKTDPHP